jgi:hypothetical protein
VLKSVMGFGENHMDGIFELYQAHGKGCSDQSLLFSSRGCSVSALLME